MWMRECDVYVDAVALDGKKTTTSTTATKATTTGNDKHNSKLTHTFHSVDG